MPKPSTLHQAVRAGQNVLEQASVDGITAAKHADVVLNVADVLCGLKREKEALPWVEAALRLAPHRIDWQWKLASLHDRLGNPEKAAKSANLVWERAEDEELLKVSSALLKIKTNWSVPTGGEGATDPSRIVLIRLGKVGDWVLHEASEILHRRTGLPVVLAEKSIDLGFPDRTGAEAMLKRVKDSIKWSHPGVIQVMRDLGITNRDSATDEQYVKLVSRLLMNEGRTTEARDFAVAFAEAAKQRQWNTGGIITKLDRTAKESGGKALLWVGFTEADIFNDKTNFVFANSWMPPPMMMVSCARFKASFWGEGMAQDKARFLKRLEKQLLSSFGSSLGVPRCTDPRCVRAYPASLDELDAKGSAYCAECRAGIEKVLGRPLPELPTNESK